MIAHFCFTTDELTLRLLTTNNFLRERGGVLVERPVTPKREVLGSIPTSVTVLCH